MEQSILQSLSTPHRQKVTRQLRKEQVKRYLDHIKQGSVRRERKENPKKTRVEFQKIFLLQEAVESFNDREVARLLNQGVDKNFVTGNDTSLLHKCVEEENYSAAELLIREGVNINAGDVDGWTPLHMACHCQAVDMVQLILNNGGDATRLDVDGFFPHDHAPQDSETREIMQQHMESKGLSEKDLQEVRLKVPLEMFTEVKDHLSHGGNPNKENENGITLLHIACANGYRKVIRLLLKHGADVNQADNDGWTSLHIAARYNQMRVVQTLLRSGADPLMSDSVGCTPSQVTTNNEIRALLTKAERKQRKLSSWRDSELPDNLDDDADIDADEETMMGHLVRINSKNVRPRHTTIAKEDEMLELRQRKDSVNQAQEVIRADDSYVTLGADDTDVTQTVDDVYEEIYVSKLWRNVDESKAQLPPVMESDNLTDLAVISEKSALESIQERFTAGQIYTLIGDILIAVNPFTEMYIYSKEVSQRYHGKSSAPLPPHVYKVAERAHDCMLSTQTSQCCVISGESGAGKTETCKYLIQHLVFIAGSDESNLNSKISQVNPVLEAFGNARTVVNSNSSRFAKFMQLSFNGKGRIVGANLTEFLLEKSRVVLRGEGELSFHIFYWMFSGISPEEANLYHLHDISKHRYLAQGGADVKSRINTNNKEKFWELKQCLQYIGFTSDEIQKILQLLAALLHLGDVTFGSHGNHDAATIANPDQLDLVSEMLEVPSEELGSALVSEFTVTRGEQIRKDRTRQQAGDCRDALAKAVYGRLFSWIVNGINQMIHPIDPSSDKFQIGILDIFGFENFTRNSFEQMCINLANEQMQSYANEYIFMKEQEDCLLEGVPLVELNFKNNQPIIDTFMERNAGILAIIDEESRFPKGTDISLATKLHQGPGEKYPEVYKIPKDKGPSFTVVHYAGVVKYDLIGVLEKNRDTLPNAVLCTMKTSNCLQVKELFQSRMTRTGSLAPSARQQRSRKSRQSPFEFFKKLKGGKSKMKNVTPVVPYEKKGPSTMAYHFKNSLSDLLSRIQAASPHIIRCIRPNIHRTPRHFVPEYVLAQMRYTGIAETIKIKKHGYSARLKFRDFLVVFDTLRTVLVPPYSMISDEQKCREVIKFCGLGSETQSHQVTIGKSKLFFHEADLRKLDQISNKVKEQVIICQSAVRKYLAKKRYAKLQTKSAEENERKVQEFCHQMALQHDKVTSWIQFQRGHDEGRIQNTKKAEKETDLGGSGESLNEILSQYDEVLGKYQDDDDSEEDDSYADVLNLITDMSVQHSRGLPPPPCGAMIMRDNPPPNPKEMYAQAGIYDVIPGEKATKRPAPPKRSASTRLSSGRDRVSVSSDDAVFLDEHHRPTNQNSPLLSPRLSRSNHHQQHHPQMRRSSSPGQPRQAVPSPNQSRPFSYFTPPSTPSQPPSNTPHLISPGSPTYEPIHQPGHPHNGHHHSTHHQHHRPRVSSNVEVRALSPSRHGQHQRHSAGGSPKSSKRQSMPVKPVAPPQQVRDVNFPQHVSPLNPQHVRDANFPHHVQPLAAHQHSVPQGQETDPSGRRPRAPSFPAPPTPLSGSIRSQGSRRSPSPPLPPPPLQPNVRPMNIRHSTEVIHTRVSEPPTPPPISKIPGTRSSVSSFELGKRSREGSVESPLQSPTHHTGYHGNTDQFSLASQLTKVKLKTGAVPPQQEKTSFKQQAAMGIAAELVLKKTPLRHSPKEAPPKKTPDENREISPEALLKKLNPVKRTEGSKTSPDNETGTAVNFLPKLRPTGGQKPWEKDPSPTLDSADVVMDVMTSSIDEEPLPPEPLVEEEPVEELPLPPPPPTEDSEPVQPQPGVALDTPSTTTNKKRMIFEKEKKDIGDNMDIDLDEIDYSQIPGYVPITNAVPNWKKDMIIKKNEEKVREYVEELRRKKAEALKWKDVPEWKKKMLEKKEQQKREQDSAMTQAAQQKEQAKTAKIKPVLQKRQSFDETQTNNNTTFVTKNPVSPVTKQPVSPPVAKQPEKSPVTKQPESPPVTSMPKNPVKVTNDKTDIDQTIGVEQVGEDNMTTSMVHAKSENVGLENQSSVDNRSRSMVDAESQNMCQEKPTVEDRVQSTCQPQSEENRSSQVSSEEVYNSQQLGNDRGTNGHHDEIGSHEQCNQITSHGLDDCSDQSKTETLYDQDDEMNSCGQGIQKKSPSQFPSGTDQLDENSSPHDYSVEMSPKQDDNDQPHVKDPTVQINDTGSQQLHGRRGSQDLSTIKQEAGNSSPDVCDKGGSCDEVSMDDPQDGMIIQSSDEQREEEERKREARRRQLEMQAQMEKELADVPEWKREIMMKKGGAPTNWGDEREDINRDENNEENQNYE